jgi:hypothetical protein
MIVMLPNSRLGPVIAGMNLIQRSGAWDVRGQRILPMID